MHKYIISLALLLSSLGALAQDDFGAWLSISGEQKITKKWSVGIEGEMRTRDNSAAMDRWSIGMEHDYKLHKHLKASAGYTFIYNNTRAKENYRESDGTLKWSRPDYWVQRHRLYASLTGDIDLGRWNLSLRERWQYTYRMPVTVMRSYYTKTGEYNYSEPDKRASKNKHVLRSRLQVSYDIPKCPLNPYASVEITNGWELDKTRYTLGADWKINKKSTLGISYIYQDVKADDGDDDVNTHVVSLSFKQKF